MTRRTRDHFHVDPVTTVGIEALRNAKRSGLSEEETVLVVFQAMQTAREAMARKALIPEDYDFEAVI